MPQTVRIATIGMFTLAGMYVIHTIVLVTPLLRELGGDTGAARTVESQSFDTIVFIAVVTSISAALFTALTFMVRRGVNWACFISCAVLLLAGMSTVLGLTRGYGGLADVLVLAMLPIEIGAFVLLTRKTSKQYFRPHTIQHGK